MATTPTTTPEAETAEPEGRGGVLGAADKAIETARETATHALETTRDTARSAAQRTVETVDTSPLAVLAGGVALGVLVGVLLPRLARERELLGPLGARLAEGATTAVKAARDAGKAEIESLIPDADGAKERVTKLFGTVLDAAKNAGKNQAN